MEEMKEEEMKEEMRDEGRSERWKRERNEWINESDDRINER